MSLNVRQPLRQAQRTSSLSEKKRSTRTKTWILIHVTMLDVCSCHEMLQRSASLTTRLDTSRTALVRDKARPRTAAEPVAQLQLGTTVHWRFLQNELVSTASSLAEMRDGDCLDHTPRLGTSCGGGTGRGKRVSTRRTSAGEHQRVDDHECDCRVRTETAKCRHADQASARDSYRRRWPNEDLRALHLPNCSVVASCMVIASIHY
jgi:hypothetical protein